MKYLICILSIFTFVAVGCEGLQGPEGPQGPPGEDGSDGAANITSSVYSYNRNDVNISDDGNVAWVRFSNNAVTGAVVNNGAVMAYFDTNIWTALPLNNYSSEVEITYSYVEGAVDIVFYNKQTFAGLTADDIPVRDVKFVIIPPDSANNKMKNSEAYKNRVKEPGLMSKEF